MYHPHDPTRDTGEPYTPRYCEKHRMELHGHEVCWKCSDELDQLMEETASRKTVEAYHAVTEAFKITKTTAEKPKA